MKLYELLDWLDTHGGRTMDDVCEHNRGEYVWMMGAEGHNVKVHIRVYPQVHGGLTA